MVDIFFSGFGGMRSQQLLPTAAAGFKELNEMLHEKRARLFLARLHPPVEEMLARAHALDNVLTVP